MELRSSRVVVVGVGALGSHLVQFIRNVPNEITIIDFDRVEQRNVLSQFHGKPHVGKNKTLSLIQTMNLLFGRKLVHVPNKLTLDNVGGLLGGAKLSQKVSLVVDCLDNAEGRIVIQEHVREYETPCVHGALAANGEYGRVVWDENFAIDSEVGAGAATCEGGEFLPFVTLTAAYLARSIQIFLASGKKVGFAVSPGGAVAV